MSDYDDDIMIEMIERMEVSTCKNLTMSRR